MSCDESEVTHIKMDCFNGEGDGFQVLETGTSEVTLGLMASFQ